MITILPNYYNTWENLLSAIYTNTTTAKKETTKTTATKKATKKVEA